MSESTIHPLEYYARPGLMTDPGEHTSLFDGLPTEIPALCQVVRGTRDLYKRRALACAA